MKKVNKFLGSVKSAALKLVAKANAVSIPSIVAIAIVAGFTLSVISKLNNPMYAYTPVKQTTDGGLKPAPETHITVSTPTERFVVPNERTVILSGEVGDQSRDIAKEIADLSKESTSPIYLLINSPGGSVLDGVLIIQAMQASRAPVNTICTQICASMAAMIFEYGTKRYLGNKAMLMFHPASGGAQGELDKMVSRLTFMQSFIGGIEAYIANRTGLSYSEYKLKSGVELWVEGTTAIKTNFADSLVLLEGDVVFSNELRFQGLMSNPDKKESSKGHVLPGRSIDLYW